MKRPPEDKEKENRIDMEIVVDCYNETEKAMGWHCYLDENLKFPFKARCIKQRSMSPLKLGEEIEVISMAEEDDCMNEMFVLIKWDSRKLAVPLSQLEAVKPSKKTKEAMDDWLYWVSRGYQF